MKKRSALIIAILVMAIGFASISTTLIINGSARVFENTEDFSVIFTKASLDGQDVYANIIDDTKKIINFNTKDLKNVGDTSVLTYELTNNSANYDAEVQVNCKVKDIAEAKYTSIKNELEGNATVVKAKETLNGTLTITLNKTATEEVREEYVCELTFNAVERDELGQGIPDPVSFTTDSWQTIQKAVQTGNTELYNIGDTKEVDLDSFGTHTVRIANKSECESETSETACGFVVEFADIITQHSFNSTATNVGGWRDSELRTYVNDTIYKSLPSDLQNVIAITKVISGHGSTSGENNFESSDKMYLMSTKEIWGESKNDTLNVETKQLDYYAKLNVIMSNSPKVLKKYNNNYVFWWLRSPNSLKSSTFVRVNNGGWDDGNANNTYGISPAFRIG